jgi:EXLDI family protein
MQFMPSTPEFPSDPEVNPMPNKTIYVADGDLPVFERAQELAGENLSATIAEALRRFVESEEARARGFVEIRLKTGSHKTYSVKRFMGRELARRRARDEQRHSVITHIVFQTAKGSLALYTRTSPDWSSWSQGWGGDWNVDVDVDIDSSRGNWHVRRGRGRDQASGGMSWGGQDWSAWAEGDERRLEVYPSLEELKPHIPEELASAVAQALRGEEDEFLDI